MNKNDTQIIVTPTKKLFGDDYFEGFATKDGINYEQRILKNMTTIRRGDAEVDTTYKQPIGYAIIINPTKKLVYIYQRAGQNNYDENRLEGKWSWGVGGHIDGCEITQANPIHSSMLRELQEEITIKGSIKPQVIGYINDDSNDVGKVHFGILYAIITDATIAYPNDKESSCGSMRPFSFIQNLELSQDAEIENWSKIAIPYIQSVI